MQKPTPDDEFLPAGLVRLTPAAITYAREFDREINSGGGEVWVVGFDWAISLVTQREPGGPDEEFGPCLLLGAFRRRDVGPEFLDKVAGLAFVCNVPKSLLSDGKTIIDVDESLPFKLVRR